MTSARRRFSTGERVKRFPIEPMHRPLAERLGLKRSIEAERRLIPVEHIPFEARVSTLYGELGERREERLADALATTLGQHEEVFEPEPMAACPRGVGDEVEREAYASLALQCDSAHSRFIRRQFGRPNLPSTHRLKDDCVVLELAGDFTLNRSPARCSNSRRPSRNLSTQQG